MTSGAQKLNFPLNTCIVATDVKSENRLTAIEAESGLNTFKIVSGGVDYLGAALDISGAFD